MDTITHGIVGALAGKAFFSGFDFPSTSRSETSVAESDPIARVAITACTIGAIFPDIDVFAGPIARNPIAIIDWHRNITHSLVLLPVWALLLAGMTVPFARWLRWKQLSFGKLAGIYAFGLATHVFLDVVTNFGTMVWSPLQYSRLAWDWLYIVDLTLTGLALVPQLVAWCYQDPAKFKRRAGPTWGGAALAAFGGYLLAASVGYAFSIWVVGVVSALVAAALFVPAIHAVGFGWRRASWCRAGFVLVCVYLGLAATAHRQALVDTKDFAESQHLQVESLAALPLPPTATHWAAVISTPEGVWRRTFRVPGAKVERTQFFSDERLNPYVQEAKKLRDVQVYLWFARFPIWKVIHREGQTVAEVSDVRFFREDQDTQESAGDRSSGTFFRARRGTNGFAFDVVFDAQGQIVSHGFRKP